MLVVGYGPSRRNSSSFMPNFNSIPGLATSRSLRQRDDVGAVPARAAATEGDRKHKSAQPIHVHRIHTAPWGAPDPAVQCIDAERHRATIAVSLRAHHARPAVSDHPEGRSPHFYIGALGDWQGAGGASPPLTPRSGSFAACGKLIPNAIVLALAVSINEYESTVPNGNTDFDLQVAQQWFSPIAGVLWSFAECHNLLVDRYYHDSPSWTFRVQWPAGYDRNVSQGVLSGRSE